MGVLDGLTFYGTPYDLQDSHAVRFNESQTLMDEQKRVARVNIAAEESSAVEIIPETNGYIYLETPATDTAVPMSGGAPVITGASTSANTPYYSLIEVSEGETYSVSCRGNTQHGAGFLVIAENGTILDRQAGISLQTVQTRVITIPSNAKWLYVVVNRATGSTARGTENRFWAGAYTPVRVSMLETGKQDATVTETVSGTTASISATANHQYNCGELEGLTVTAPATGIFAVRWTSGSTATLVTLTGITMPDWWTGCDPGRVYELNVEDGYGVVMSWPVPT